METTGLAASSGRLGCRHCCFRARSLAFQSTPRLRSGTCSAHEYLRVLPLGPLPARCSTEAHCAVRSFDTRCCRRDVLHGGALTGLSFFLYHSAAGAALSSQEQTVAFVNRKQGYQLQHPATWEETSKAGADVLFRDKEHKGAEVGVTVNPVRVTSLEQFGDVSTTGNRLLQAERAKESTQSVLMLREATRRRPSGAMIYAFDYDLDTTRGRKRILCSVAIANKKLYIVNGSVKLPATPADGGEVEHEIDTVRTMVESFDLLT